MLSFQGVRRIQHSRFHLAGRGFSSPEKGPSDEAMDERFGDASWKLVCYGRWGYNRRYPFCNQYVYTVSYYYYYYCYYYYYLFTVYRRYLYQDGFVCGIAKLRSICFEINDILQYADVRWHYDSIMITIILFIYLMYILFGFYQSKDRCLEKVLAMA